MAYPGIRQGTRDHVTPETECERSPLSFNFLGIVKIPLAGLAFNPCKGSDTAIRGRRPRYPVIEGEFDRALQKGEFVSAGSGGRVRSAARRPPSENHSRTTVTRPSRRMSNSSRLGRNEREELTGHFSRGGERWSRGRCRGFVGVGGCRRGLDHGKNGKALVKSWNSSSLVEAVRVGADGSTGALVWS